MITGISRHFKSILVGLKEFSKSQGLSLALFAFAALILNMALSRGRSEAKFYLEDNGGPDPAVSAETSAAVESSGLEGENNQGDFLGFTVVESSILHSDSPLSSVLPTRNGLMIYRIQEGDTIYEIAANFGINVDTVVWANPNLKPSLLRPGQEVMILPVSGVLHSIQEGESLESVASVYGVLPEDVKRMNPDFQKLLQLKNAPLIIPQGRPQRGWRNSASANLPDLGNYFILPATGWNWSRLHGYNATDIANICGTPVYAAAEGLVTGSGNPRSWNNGYGGFVKIEHPSGASTVYAHLEKILVNQGNYVLQGDGIARMGSTGNVHGPTGCHLHFEVHKAKNPFAK